MPHAETYEFRGKPLLVGMHPPGRHPEVYVEYGPYFHHEYGNVVAAKAFVEALAALSPDEPAVMSLQAVRDCCGFRPWASVIERAIWWRPGETVVLQIGQNKFTTDTFHHLVRWLASMPFMDPCHEPHIELDEETQAGFNRLCQRLGVQSPLHAA